MKTIKELEISIDEFEELLNNFNDHIYLPRFVELFKDILTRIEPLITIYTKNSMSEMLTFLSTFNASDESYIESKIHIKKVQSAIDFDSYNNRRRTVYQKRIRNNNALLRYNVYIVLLRILPIKDKPVYVRQIAHYLRNIIRAYKDLSNPADTSSNLKT